MGTHASCMDDGVNECVPDGWHWPICPHECWLVVCPPPHVPNGWHGVSCPAWRPGCVPIDGRDACVPHGWWRLLYPPMADNQDMDHCFAHGSCILKCHSLPSCFVKNRTVQFSSSFLGILASCLLNQSLEPVLVYECTFKAAFLLSLKLLSVLFAPLP